MANPFTGGTVNFMPQGTQSIGNPDSTQILRAQQYAQMLRQQAEQPEEYNQVVSGRVVPYSWAQGLAKIGKSYMAGQAEKQADEMMKNYQQERGKRLAQTLSDYQKALEGTPEKVEEFKPDTFDETDRPFGTTATGQAAPYGGMMLNVTPGKAPSQQEAMGVLMQNPDTAQAAMDAQLKRMSDIEKYGHEVKYTAEGKPYLISDQGNVKWLQPDVSQQVDYNKPFLANGQPNPAYQRYELGKARAGASNVSVNTAQKPFLTEIGKGVGEAVNNAYAQAQQANQTLANVDQIRKGLDNAILGPGANTRVTLAQIGQIMGVAGKDDVERLQNTRDVIQGLARNELAAAGQMKGQGQITESERALLKKAESGDIGNLTKPEVKTLLNAMEKTANYRIGVHNANLQRLSQDPNAAPMVDYMRVNPVSGTGSSGANLQDAVAAELRRRGIK